MRILLSGCCHAAPPAVSHKDCFGGVESDALEHITDSHDSLEANWDSPHVSKEDPPNCNQFDISSEAGVAEVEEPAAEPEAPCEKAMLLQQLQLSADSFSSPVIRAKVLADYINKPATAIRVLTGLPVQHYAIRGTAQQPNMAGNAPAPSIRHQSRLESVTSSMMLMRKCRGGGLS